MYATTEARGLFFCFYINIEQITPLENGDQNICGELKAKIAKFYMEPLWRRDYIVIFPSILQITPLENGDNKICGALKAKKLKLCMEPLWRRDYIVAIPSISNKPQSQNADAETT